MDEQVVEQQEQEQVEAVAKMRPVLLRFPPEHYEAIKDIAAEHNMSAAAVVRCAVYGQLARYYSGLRYIDMRQGKEIHQQLMALSNAMSQIAFELRRVGVNYNQEVKLRQIEKKYEGKKGIDAAIAKGAEIEQVQKECKSLDLDALDKLIGRYEDATKEVGAVLCRLLG